MEHASLAFWGVSYVGRLRRAFHKFHKRKNRQRHRDGNSNVVGIRARAKGDWIFHMSLRNFVLPLKATQAKAKMAREHCMAHWKSIIRIVEVFEDCFQLL